MFMCMCVYVQYILYIYAYRCVHVCVCVCCVCMCMCVCVYVCIHYMCVYVVQLKFRGRGSKLVMYKNAKLYSFQVSYCIRDHATPEVKKRQVTEAIRISPWYHSTVEG